MYDDHTHLKKVPFVCSPSRICLIINWFAYFIRKKFNIFIAPAGDFYTKSFTEICKNPISERESQLSHIFLKWVYHFFLYILVGLFVLCLWDLLLLLYVYLRMNAYCLHTSHHPRGSLRRGLPFEGTAGSGHEWIYLLIVITPYISCIL